MTQRPHSVYWVKLNMQCNGDVGSALRWPEDETHHAVVEPLRDEVVQQFGVDQLSVVQVEGPEGEHHELWGDTHRQH